MLHLYGNHVSDIGAQSLAKILSFNNMTLNRLCLNSNSITDEGVQYLAQMLQTNRTLTHLALGENEIGDRGVELLSNALAHRKHSLESLSICSNKSASDSCVDSLVTMLKQNRSLKQLSMSDCSLSVKKKEKLRQLAKSKKPFHSRGIM
jgi:Ran GTPase-activating protein (RanGAP) involved in mRNA processing and transport